MSESGVDPNTSVPLPFLPIAMFFDWDSVVNGHLAEETHFEFTQGETVLFRTISAGVEPTMYLSWNDSAAEGPDFMVVAEDGFPVTALETTNQVAVGSGQRVEFMAKFDTAGTYQLRREAWTILGIRGVDGCTAAFGIPLETCLSYDIEQPIATITVLPADDDEESLTVTKSLPTEVPEYDKIFKEMEAMEVATTRTVDLKQQVGFPIFQVPYAGDFVPPGVGFGINERLYTPHYRHGQIQAGTCEEWTVTSDPPGAEHSFHIHTSPFLVTHEDGVPVAEPFWRDTYTIFSHNITIKACFNRLEPGDYVFVHCHATAHIDVGVSGFISYCCKSSNFCS